MYVRTKLSVQLPLTVYSRCSRLQQVFSDCLLGKLIQLTALRLFSWLFLISVLWSILITNCFQAPENWTLDFFWSSRKGMNLWDMNVMKPRLEWRVKYHRRWIPISVAVWSWPNGERTRSAKEPSKIAPNSQLTENEMRPENSGLLEVTWTSKSIDRFFIWLNTLLVKVTEICLMKMVPREYSSKVLFNRV